MSKFTKGPWRVELSSFGDIESASVFYPHGFLTSANVIEVDETRIKGESWLEMRERTAKERKSNELESIANMYLISAAPDMYKALKSMHDFFLSEYGEDDPYVLDSAKALAKADGKGE